MKKIFLLVFSLQIIFYSRSQSVMPELSKPVMLPNGWSLTPVGKSLELGDLPLNMAISPSKKWMAVSNSGESKHSIQVIDLATQKILVNKKVEKTWYGLKFSADEKYLYASGSHDNWISKYSFQNNKLVLVDSIKLGDKWPNKICPAGLDIDYSKNLLYTVTKEDNSLYVIDLNSKKILQKKALGGEGYACLLSPDNKILYISCWGCDKVYLFNTQAKEFTDEIAVGDNPNEICLTKKGDYLFVCNANDNSVSVINTSKRKVVEVLNAALFPNSPSGSTTNGVALSDDERKLYIANADNNCLAVFDVSRPGSSKSLGFIPTGWYPTNVKVIGKKIFVTNGKGFTSKANPLGPNPTRKHEEVIYQGGKQVNQYIGGLFLGTLGIIDQPTEEQLSSYSRAVYNNSRYGKTKELEAAQNGNPIPANANGKSPIKYVFYIIKENRTYDQVLSDIPGGNGDSSLVLFGRKYTPNQHNLAEQFVLLDNFYCDGEVSADGHNWSLGGYATDYLEKNWPQSYGHRGGDYDAEGTRAIANNKVFIWDQCKKAGISYRTYGEFADSFRPNLPILQNHFCPYYTSWDQSVRDTTRFFEWKREFDSLLANNAVPQFNSMRFINDHTEGLKKNRPTPFANVADNDWAVGLFIEHLSKSKIWKETAVFIVEDDAQNGPDHVDAHRTTAYVAGGFVKRKFIDHTMYSTTSILHTIELILGLQPMSQYDASSEPMWRCFANTADLTPFKSVPPNIDITERNVAVNQWQKLSETFNFAKEDAAPDMPFNLVLWHGIKGDNVPFPAPRRAAFLNVSNKVEED